MHQSVRVCVCRHPSYKFSWTCYYSTIEHIVITFGRWLNPFQHHSIILNVIEIIIIVILIVTCIIIFFIVLVIIFTIAFIVIAVAALALSYSYAAFVTEKLRQVVSEERVQWHRCSKTQVTNQLKFRDLRITDRALNAEAFCPGKYRQNAPAFVAFPDISMWLPRCTVLHSGQNRRENRYTCECVCTCVCVWCHYFHNSETYGFVSSSSVSG